MAFRPISSPQMIQAIMARPIGQTQAAHKLCSGLPEKMKAHHLQKKVGHYGVFNGSRFRAEIVPRVAGFIRQHTS